MKEHLKSWPTDWLLRTKKDQEFEASNWQRRIGEIESGVIDASGYPPVAEYRRRIEKIREKISDDDENPEILEEMFRDLKPQFENSGELPERPEWK